MGKYCVYCGNPIKEGIDKFCIICGKPVLAGVKKPEKTEVEKARDIIKERKTPKQRIIEESIEEDPFEAIPEVSEKKGKKKGKKGASAVVEKPLPFEVKEQMILNIEYNDIKLNKQILVDKLKEIQQAIKDPRYDVDEDYNRSINIKVTAIKTLIAELKQKETDLEEKMDKPFIVQRIQEDIDTKIFQLKNLSQQHKLHKVDKDSFESLREKYKQEKEVLETERKDLTVGMKLWIKELKMEKAELQTQKNLNKGRFSAKELSKEDYEAKRKDFEIKLKKIALKIKTLEDLTK